MTRSPGPGVVAQTFALLGGAVGYASHLLFGSAFVPWACELGTTLPIHALTLAVLGMIALSGVVGWRVYHRTQELGLASTPHWMAGVGLLLNGLFFVIVLYGELPVWFLDPCLP